LAEIDDKWNKSGDGLLARYAKKPAAYVTVHSCKLFEHLLTSKRLQNGYVNLANCDASTRTSLPLDDWLK
jgi:hypothetical protein